jgi:hypothetical protein
MRIFDMIVAAMLGGGLTAFAFALLWIFARFRRRTTKPPTVTVETIAERVRGVGKLVGLEVFAKEIATATSGLSWMPPLLISQARLAMIFAFRKQYFVDLTRLDEADIEPMVDGRFSVRMPAVEGDLHLIDVTPYDVQDGRVLGLVDVIPMNAMRQGTLMQAARGQASELYERNDDKYLTDARRSIERHLKALLRLFDVEVELHWPESSRSPREPVRDIGASPVLAGMAG